MNAIVNDGMDSDANIFDTGNCVVHHKKLNFHVSFISSIHKTFSGWQTMKYSIYTGKHNVIWVPIQYKDVILPV